MMKCTYCGFENPDNSKFCVNCGGKFENSVAPQPEQPPIYQTQQPQTPYQPQQPTYQPQQPTYQPQQPVMTNQVYMNEPPKKKRKGCLIAVIVVVALFIGLIAIASSGDDTDAPTQSNNTSSVASHDDQPANTTPSTEETPSQDENSKDVGNYGIEFVDKQIIKQDSKDILLVTYKFTNNSDEANCFNYAVTDHAYQDGIELGTVWSSYGIEGLDFDDQSKNIQPGKSLDVKCAYELNDLTTDVIVEFQLFTVWDDEIYKRITIELD